jgi:transposase
MTLHPQLVQPIPKLTKEIAKQAFPKDNLYMMMRDRLGTFYTDWDFVDLFPTQGQPATCPWRLALITVIQFVEGLTDRQAASAVASRIDWKYALSLELTDKGFNFSVLSEFRTRLIEGGAERQLFDLMLSRFQEAGLLKAPYSQRTDSTHVLAKIRNLSRLENLGETLRSALNSIAVVAPQWLQEIVPDNWYKRYVRKFEESRLPMTETKRTELAATIGRDGFYLLDILWSSEGLSWLRQINAVEILRQVWLQQYYAPESNGEVHLRNAKDSPPGAIRIRSPYDQDARLGNKRSKSWTGYKVHLSETCDQDVPHLITSVETTRATITDREVLEEIHEELAEHDLLPSEHLVDAGYMDAELMVNSQTEYGVNLIGPIPIDGQWQSKAGKGYGIADFKVDWKKELVRCPIGKVSRKWIPTHNTYQQPVISVKFNKADCLSCSVRADCTRAKAGARTVTLRPMNQHQAIQVAREKQQTPEFKEQYALRAGVEGTISQGTRTFGLRRCRYRGEAKTRLQNFITAAAINLVRVWDWWCGTSSLGTVPSQFAALAQS